MSFKVNFNFYVNFSRTLTTKQIFTDEGLCFTTNNFNPLSIFRNAYVPPRTAVKKGDIDDFNFEASGRENGISIILYCPGCYTDNYCNRLQEGYKIFIHNPNEYPNSKSYSINVPFDSVSDIIVKPHVYSIDESVHSFLTDIRKCYVEGERELKYFKAYNKNNCELECNLNISLSLYNCSVILLPIGNADYSMCNIAELDNETHNFWTAKRSCNCLPNCDNIVYDIEASNNIANTTDYWKILEEFYRKPTDNENSINDKYNEITIFFRQTTVSETKIVAHIWWSDFIADCGGLLGIFMGISILSVVEIFYFVVVNSIHKLVFKNKNQQFNLEERSSET